VLNQNHGAACETGSKRTNAGDLPMPLLTLTVNNASPALDKKFQEVALIERALDLAQSNIRAAGGVTTSGNIINDGGTVIGSWTYTPQASS
jgi:hypothetical protein